MRRTTVGAAFSTTKQTGIPFRPVVVRVGPTTFEVAVTTLRQFPDSLLAALFDEPFPLFDSGLQAHVLPTDIAVSDSVFSVILDFLRCGSWLPIRSEQLFDDVVLVCRRLGLPAEPVHRPMDRASMQAHVDVVSIAAERPPHGGLYELHESVALMGRRGFKVVSHVATAAERHFTTADADYRLSPRRQAPTRSLKHDLDRKAGALEPVDGTVLLMERTAPRLFAVEAVRTAQEAPYEHTWNDVLLQCA